MGKQNSKEESFFHAYFIENDCSRRYFELCPFAFDKNKLQDLCNNNNSGDNTLCICFFIFGNNSCDLPDNWIYPNRFYDCFSKQVYWSEVIFKKGF